MTLNDQQRMVFVSGLKNTGASYLVNLMATADNVIQMRGHTEGQFHQGVYCNEIYLGGGSGFAFSPRAHLTEESPLVTPENRQQLLDEWLPHYADTNKDYFLERSSTNLVKTRFLQALFPDSYFVTVIRHPLATAYAQKRQFKDNIKNLIEHWISAYTIYMEDRRHLKNELLISYEQIEANPQQVYKAINDFLGIKVIELQQVRSNKIWFKRWHKKRWWEPKLLSKRRHIISKYESGINEFGYSFKNLRQFPQPKVKLVS